jgi:hypothetical protein
MSKILLTSSAAVLTLSFCFGLGSEAGASSVAVCERVRHVCLGTGKSAEFCQANFEHCRNHQTHTGGLTSDDLLGAVSLWGTTSNNYARDHHPTPASVEVQAPGSKVNGGRQGQCRSFRSAAPVDWQRLVTFKQDAAMRQGALVQNPTPLHFQRRKRDLGGSARD